MAEAAPLNWLADADPRQLERLMTALNPKERSEFPWHWKRWARPSQLAPQGHWRLRLVMAGRGFGKTRCCAEWADAIAERNLHARIALIASNQNEARSVMIEGESDLCRSARRGASPASSARCGG